MNSLLNTDGYKTGHKFQYPPGTEYVYSNWTPRKSRIQGIDHVVHFGLQHFIKKWLIEDFHDNFFMKPKGEIVREYKRMMDNYLGKDSVDVKHIEDLWELGYLPLKIKSLPEGSLVPMRCPAVTIINTAPKFFWLTNYIETMLSAELWMPTTSATIAREYRKLLNYYCQETGGDPNFIQFQGHDFSMRGMAGIEAAKLSGMGHLLSFVGTDTIPAIIELEKYYRANSDEELIGCSVNATEHAVQCAGGKEGELETFKRLLFEVYPKGIVSVVSDTWDLWKVLTEYLPNLKDKILARDGKLVIRPDSGNPVDIICGNFSTVQDVTNEVDNFEEFKEYAKEDIIDFVRDDTPHGEYGVDSHSIIYKFQGKYYKCTIDNFQWNRHDKQFYFIDFYEDPNLIVEEIQLTPENKGVIELLWDVFGGIINEKGFKVLDPHIGAIYGDSITLDRCQQICERLKAKGFASTNIVFGIGSFTYQYNTRDTFGFAMKATWCQVNGKSYDIFKDPITDDGTKKSAKGLIQIIFDTNKNEYFFRDQVDPSEEDASNCLETVFENGKLVKETLLSEIRNRLWSK